MENTTKQSNLLSKSSSQSAEVIKRFGLQHVSILIEQTGPTTFAATALEFNSPLNYQGTAKDVGDMFGKWVTNTLKNMEANSINDFLIYAQL